MCAPSETRIEYRARGLGPTYDAFCSWLRNRPTRKEWNDWPWFGWAFVDAINDQAIVDRWSEHFLTPDPDDVRLEDDPVEQPASPDEIFLMNCLQDAITEELNNQIIAKVRK